MLKNTIKCVGQNLIHETMKTLLPYLIKCLPGPYNRL